MWAEWLVPQARSSQGDPSPFHEVDLDYSKYENTVMLQNITKMMTNNYV